MQAIQVSTPGSPSVLQFKDLPKPQLTSSTDILIRNEYIGVNYIDVYFRNGAMKTTCPFIPGYEGAGIVEQVGDKVKGFKVGDKVGYLGVGTYAEYSVVPEGKAMKLPSDVDTKQAASIMLQGATAVYLATDTYKVQKGDWVFVPAAAGGLGRLLCQLCLSKGANVIGLTTSPHKVDEIKSLGVKHVICGSETDKVVEQVQKITNDQGVKVVYDGVGKAFLETAFKALSKRGHYVSFGHASGPIPPLDLSILVPKCISAHCTSLTAYAATPEEFKTIMQETFGLVKNGIFKQKIFKVYPLKDASEAHADLEGKKTQGKLLLQL